MALISLHSSRCTASVPCHGRMSCAPPFDQYYSDWARQAGPEGHGDIVRAIACTPQGLVFTAGYDCTVRPVSSNPGSVLADHVMLLPHFFIMRLFTQGLPA